MEFQKKKKRKHLLDNTTNQLTKFRKKHRLEINDESNRVCNTGGQIKFKTSISRSSLCDYSDAYILVSGTTKTDGVGANYNAKRLDERNKEVIFKNCAPFTDCISEINNTQILNTRRFRCCYPNLEFN